MAISTAAVGRVTRSVPVAQQLLDRGAAGAGRVGGAVSEGGGIARPVSAGAGQDRGKQQTHQQPRSESKNRLEIRSHEAILVFLGY